MQTVFLSLPMRTLQEAVLRKYEYSIGCVKNNTLVKYHVYSAEKNLTRRAKSARRSTYYRSGK